ncbi:amidophosphoribosyltransferase [Roseimarinus sediminis]|jgi:amidophosphoribosyltransferase|uniref:amidophosphoribosyltransferase n=1 Tax=Roseimarinus sediminis TaxID=1610899 RepID=UPI003D1BE6E6
MSGFFGATALSDCIDDVFYGTDYHSHLGTKRAGMAVFSSQKGYQRAIHSLEDGYFRNKFDSDVAGFEGESGIGIISDNEAQPLLIYAHLGRFALSTVAKINNIDKLAQRFLGQQKLFSETSQGGINTTELIAMLICEKQSFKEGIENVFNTIEGSCSILILNEDEIIAARDKLGRTPIIIGKREGAYCAVSETSSFLNLDYTIDKYLGPGEIVSIRPDGYKVIRKADEPMQICSFLWVYYGYPTSFYEGINVDETRYRCGARLAQNDDVEPDFVAGIPDSGIGHAMGYSNAAKIPLMRPYAKYTPTWPRSFMPQNQKTRDLVAKMKLLPNSALIEGKKGLFLDDSIVRGTQLKDNVKDLTRSGIAEVHMRIACPPLLYPCEYLNFSRSRTTLELATRKAIVKLEGKEDVDLSKYADPDSEEYGRMVEQIRKDLGLTTLKFQHLDDLVEAIGLPKEKLCTHCWDQSSRG